MEHITEGSVYMDQIVGVCVEAQDEWPVMNPGSLFINVLLRKISPRVLQVELYMRQLCDVLKAASITNGRDEIHSCSRFPKKPHRLQ